MNNKTIPHLLNSPTPNFSYWWAMPTLHWITFFIRQSSFAFLLLTFVWFDGFAVAGSPQTAGSSPHPSRSDSNIDTKLAPPISETVTNDWPSFLGPTHNGISTETKLLKQWPIKGPKIVWQINTGVGFASPSILGDRLVFFHRVGDEEIALCLNPQTGKQYWQFKYPCDYKDRYGFNNGPRSSPVLDGGLAYTYGVQGKLHCLDLKTGQLKWKRDLSEQFHVPTNFFGVGTTPLIVGDLLIINVGAPSGPCVVGLDKKTGKTAWKAGDQWTASYASPVPAMIHGQRRVFVYSGGDSKPPTGGLMCLDPATGAIDFSFPFRSRNQISVNAASPVVVGNQVFISSAYRTGGVMLKILPDFTQTTAWKTNDLRCHFATPIERQGYLYGFDGSASGHDTELVCLEVATGKKMWGKKLEWKETVEANGRKTEMTYGVGRGSLIWADGHFLCLGETGHLLWLDLTPQHCKMLQRTWLFAANETWTPPVISRGLLYIAQNNPGLFDKKPPRLVCYDFRAPQAGN